MRQIAFLTLISGLIFSGCNQNSPSKGEVKTSTDTSSMAVTREEKEEIQNLIRQMLDWADSKHSFDLLPALADSRDSMYIGFDLEQHRFNLDKLRETGFFAAEFIENYDQIIRTLDRKLRDGAYEPWLVGDAPTFMFANDADPWCLCQDVPNDKARPWSFMEVSKITLDKNRGKGEAEWRWKILEPHTDPGWKGFVYKFSVVKENDKWKISYLQGFDFKESIR